MKDSDKDFLADELLKDLDENPEDARHIMNGLKEGYPAEAQDIAQRILWRMQDRSLVDSLALKRSLQEMREGKTVRL
jgi:hypothetical protein